MNRDRFQLYTFSDESNRAWPGVNNADEWQEVIRVRAHPLIFKKGCSPFRWRKRACVGRKWPTQYFHHPPTWREKDKKKESSMIGHRILIPLNSCVVYLSKNAEYGHSFRPKCKYFEKNSYSEKRKSVGGTVYSTSLASFTLCFYQNCLGNITVVYTPSSIERLRINFVFYSIRPPSRPSFCQINPSISPNISNTV